MCSQSKKGTGGKNKRVFRGQVGAGVGEKDCFSAQLTLTKDDTKLIPFVILKGTTFDGRREYLINTVPHELLHRRDENNGN